MSACGMDLAKLKCLLVRPFVDLVDYHELSAIDLLWGSLDFHNTIAS